MRKFKLYFYFLLLIQSIIVSGCFEKNTTNPNDAYKYWSGQPAEKDVRVVNGKYWQSSHFSKEYVVYLEIKANDSWRNEFIQQNNLIESTSKEYPTDAPFWFKPSGKSKVWKSSDIDQESRYYFDSTNDHLFIYEVQL